ncbi:MAG: hypothetical protein ACR2H4_07365 [Pyrinomonadaceae bacterium]
MKQILVASLIALFAFSSALTQAQDKKEPEFKLVEFQMALLKRGPKWTGENNSQTKELESARTLMQHRSLSLAKQ